MVLPYNFASLFLCWRETRTMKGEVHNTVYPLHTVTIFYPIIWQYRLQNQVLASRVVHLHRTRLPCSLKRHGARNSSTHTKFSSPRGHSTWCTTFAYRCSFSVIKIYSSVLYYCFYSVRVIIIWEVTTASESRIFSHDGNSKGTREQILWKVAPRSLHSALPPPRLHFGASFRIIDPYHSVSGRVWAFEHGSFVSGLGLKQFHSYQ